MAQAMRLPHQYAAVIWDCDGVLIDSEALACAASVDTLQRLGVDITLESYIERFIGKSRQKILDELGLTSDYPETVHAEHAARQNALFKDKLKAIDGIHDVLSGAGVPMAVASGSDPDRLSYTLGLTALAPYFNGHIYSAEIVAQGKPAPDIFLLAADKLGIAPKDCLVIEDSRFGIAAARAAGMSVYAFTGGSHMTPSIRQGLIDAAPDAIVDHMQQLVRR